MKEKIKGLAKDLMRIYQAASESNDGERCMIAPSPEIRDQLKKELDRLKTLTNNSVLANLLTPKQQSKVGFNDGLVMPGNVFPLGTSAMAVRNHSGKRNLLRGAVRVAVVLVDFPDKKMTKTKAHFENLFFSKNAGSVREYFREVSNGHVDIQGEVVGPFTLPRKITAYAHGASGTGSAQPNARTMAFDAAKASAPHLNFSPYDNDADGYVDAFVVIHAGRGGEETANKHDIWSHKWVLPKMFEAEDTSIYAYLTVPEDCRLGVCAHELGHLLFGFPDLYDTDYTSEGVGNWCLMGGGSWNNMGNTPAHPCAWCKVQQGWTFVINQVANEQGVRIDPVYKTKTVYRLWKEGIQGNEYFLVENREQKNYDKFIPGSGLLVWHIDDSMESNSNEFHYRVALVQADGKKDLEKGNNRGDAGDCFPGTTKNKTLNKTSVPSSQSYGGLDTSVQITNIKQTASRITADLNVSSKRLTKKKPVKTT